MAQQNGRKFLIEAITQLKEGYQQQQSLLKSALPSNQISYTPTITSLSSPLYTRAKEKVSSLLTVYEEIIGLKQVKEAQQRVLDAELNFKECQKQRRLVQEELSQVQNQLRTLRIDIDRTARGDYRYLELIKGEIELINTERKVRSTFEQLEERERENFSELSAAVHRSHEKERYQSEKTKYWSVWGSVIGASLGIIGTTINSRIRYNQTRDILLETKSQVKGIEGAVLSLVERLDNNNNYDSLNLKEVKVSLGEEEWKKMVEEKLNEIGDRIKLINYNTNSENSVQGGTFSSYFNLEESWKRNEELITTTVGVSLSLLIFVIVYKLF